MQVAINSKMLLIRWTIAIIISTGFLHSFPSGLITETQSTENASSVEKATPDSVLSAAPGFGAFPVLFSSEQTGFAAGGGAQITFPRLSEERASMFLMLAFYTQKKQYSFQFVSENYFNEGNYKLNTENAYIYFPDTGSYVNSLQLMLLLRRGFSFWGFATN